MTSRDFTFWLQGFFELRGDTNEGLSAQQVKIVKEHLGLVFKHEFGAVPQPEPQGGACPTDVKEDPRWVRPAMGVGVGRPDLGIQIC